MAKKILIVEDDEFLRTLLADKLRAGKYEVAEAETGEKALEIIPDFDPDLILLDLLLPGIHGFEVLEWVKGQSEPLSATPVIILSNLGNQDDIKKGFDLGAKDYLVKAKFTINEIGQKIDSVTS